MILFICRLWTRGYDVYTPFKYIFSKLHDPIVIEIKKLYRGSSQLIMESLINSQKRIALLLGYSNMEFTPESVASLTKYGLGMKRTLDQLIEFTGIDLRERVVFEVQNLPYL